MKKVLFAIFVFIIASGVHRSLGQNLPAEQAGNKMDSLKGKIQVLKSTKNEHTLEDKKQIAEMYIKLSDLYKGENNYLKALNYYLRALKVAEEIKDKEGISFCYRNIGVIYNELGNYPEAIRCEIASIKMEEELNDKPGLYFSYGFLGTIYRDAGNYYEAMKYYQKVFDYKKDIGKLEGFDYGNVGFIFEKLGKYKEALEYQNIALKLHKDKKDKNGISISFNALGNIFNDQKNYTEALKNYLQALKIREEIEDKKGIASTNLNIARVYIDKGNLNDALQFANKGVLVAKEINSGILLVNGYSYLSEINAKLKNYKTAYDYKILYEQLYDSLYSKENENKVTQFQMQFDYDKKDAVTKLIQEKKDLKIQQKLTHQKLVLSFVIGGLLIVLVFAGFVFRSLRIRNKQNKIIIEQKKEVEKQKRILEVKNKAITDSINYAQRIQTSLLPTRKIVKQYLENSFILYKPKDIVAGDFYWIEVSNDLVLFAACDCTGHGVPGAMVSVVCHNALNKAVHEFGLIQPAAILDKTAEIVIENFSKSEEDIRDGMDISLCSYNTKTKELQWAGANNPIWLLQNGQLIETTGNNQSVGLNEDIKPFTNYNFTLNNGDSIYLFTDGFADQFGGETGQKKLTKKRFKNLILSIQTKSMQEQGIALDKFITEYRKEVEQIDDILVMGIKV